MRIFILPILLLLLNSCQNANFSLINANNKSMLDVAIWEYGFNVRNSKDKTSIANSYDILQYLIDKPYAIQINEKYLTEIIQYDLVNVFKYYIKTKNIPLDSLKSFEMDGYDSFADQIRSYNAQKILNYVESQE